MEQKKKTYVPCIAGELENGSIGVWSWNGTALEKMSVLTSEWLLQSQEESNHPLTGYQIIGRGEYFVESATRSHDRSSAYFSCFYQAFTFTSSAVSWESVPESLTASYGVIVPSQRSGECCVSKLNKNSTKIEKR